jgi:aminopeptidase N
VSVLYRYQQAGTPKLTVQTRYDSSAKTYTIKLQQSTPATAGQDSKKPVMIPVAMGLLGKDGQEMQLKLKVRLPSIFVA